MTGFHAAIIGGGYSGTLQAIHLLRRGASVTLIERARRMGRGVAYSTPRPEHLLNVVAGRMSAFPDEPDHFAGWLAARGGGGPSDFAQRRIYGVYLGELLEKARAAAGDRMRLVDGEAVDVVGTDSGETVLLRTGEAIAANVVLLAPGNLEPDIPSDLAPELRSGMTYTTNPWTNDIAAGLGKADHVLLIGSGLTAVDAALSLDEGGFQGNILALSRRGLVPRAHAPAPERPPAIGELPDVELSRLVGLVRRQAEAIGWRGAVDQLRPVTQQLWLRSSPQQRRRFLRHLRPWWEVHRHRIAPSIAERIRAMEANGKLVFRAGKILSVRPGSSGAEVTWRGRGSAKANVSEVSRIVNCTGPQLDIARAGDALLGRLLETGRIRRDVCRIGIDVDRKCRVLDRSGAASGTLHAIGPLTRGTFWEIVAVPDIRHQVQALADRLAG